jgi:hypothetical protein
VALGVALQPIAGVGVGEAESVGRLARRCHLATRGWFFDAVERWCASGMTKPWSRVLTIKGPAGAGKTTLLAALCCQSGGKVLTHHFNDPFDTRSQEPVAVVRTLAYRLAGNLRSYRRQLLTLGGPALHAAWQTASPVEAFTRLLLEPLGRVPPPPHKWALAVVDGVDTTLAFDQNPLLQVRVRHFGKRPHTRPVAQGPRPSRACIVTGSVPRAERGLLP